MCKVCKNALKLGGKDALNEIATSKAYQRNPEHFKETLDQLLGTKEPEQDTERDTAWERGRRGQS